jgi:hypothetical protein
MSDPPGQDVKLPSTGVSGPPGQGIPSAGRVLSAYKQMLVSLFGGTLFVIGGMMLMILPFYIRHFIAQDKDVVEPSIFVVVALCGALGSFCSALIRLYNLSDLPKAIMSDQLQDLKSVYLFVYSLVPSIVGSIAAAALYFIFAGQILEGAIFPHFVCKAAGGKCNSLTLFMASWAPDEAADFAKVLVWGFVAGFAERFVPDTLERLTKSGFNVSGEGSH